MILLNLNIIYCNYSNAAHPMTFVFFSPSLMVTKIFFTSFKNAAKKSARFMRFRARSKRVSFSLEDPGMAAMFSFCSGLVFHVSSHKMSDDCPVFVSG